MRERARGDRRRWVKIGAIGALALWALGAESAAAAELELIDPGACVTREELSFRVERAIGEPLDEAPPLGFRVHAQEKRPRAFRAELEITAATPAESGSRTLLGASCEELLDRVALAMALALGSGRDEAPRDPAPTAAAPAPVMEVVNAPEPDAPAPPAREKPDAGSPAHLVLRARLIGDTGTLPRAGFGVGAGAGLRWPSFELVALGTWLPRRDGVVEPSVPDSPGASVGLIAGSLLACVPIGANIEPVELGACAGWEIGRLAGVGTHVDEARHQASLWSAASVDLRAEWSPSQAPLGLALTLGAVAPLTRDDFIVKDIGSVYRPANVIGRASLGLFGSLE